MLIFLAGCPQRPLPRAYIRNGEAPGAVLAKMLSLIDTKEIRPAQAALALNLVSEMDFLRLKAVARLYARGLPPDVDWDDLLQEAFTRVLVGARIKPSQIAMVPFIAGIIRSLRSAHVRRALGGGTAEPVATEDENEPRHELELLDPAPGPERSLIAQQELDAVQHLFANDPLALQIIKGLGDGLSAEQIRAAGKISKVDYDSARKRMKGSAAFAGLKFPAKARFSEYFGPDALARLKELAETRRRELEDKKK